LGWKPKDFINLDRASQAFLIAAFDKFVKANKKASKKKVSKKGG